MSGHSKWSTIKRAKGITDAKRGAVFTKLANTITMAVREGGGADPNFNFRLRLAIDKGHEANMSKDLIARAIDRGAGKGGEGTTLESVVYEGFAPNGVALMIECVTDNKNRANGEIKTLLVKAGGSLGSTGSVGYLFRKRGEIIINKSAVQSPNRSVDPDIVLEMAMEAGAEDMSEDDKYYYFFTETTDLHKIRIALEEQGLTIDSAELTYMPNRETMVTITDETKAQQVINVLEALEELDDVHNVYSNLG